MIKILTIKPYKKIKKNYPQAKFKIMIFVKMRQFKGFSFMNFIKI